MKKLLLIGVVTLAPFAAAHADIIPTESSITGSGPNYTWNYSAQVTSDQTAFSGTIPGTTPVPISGQNGAFFTIYDFSGYVSGSCAAPSGWTCTTQNVGLTPNTVTPTAPSDNANVVNLTYTYTSGNGIVGPATVTGFSAQSTNNLPATGSFTARATKNTGVASGTAVDNVGNVNVPGGTSTGGGGGTGVPEPASLGLMGMALLGLGGLRRRSRKA